MTSEQQGDARGRTPEQIESDLQRTREELTETVNELSTRLAPKNLAKEASEQAKVKAAELGESALKAGAVFVEQGKECTGSAVGKIKTTLDEAKSGDLRAMGYVAGAAGCAIFIIAVCIGRRRR